MKPKFALDLSHEGINFLHRARGGWELVDSVALDDTNMGRHLAELLRAAQRLEPDGLTTKIIIPNSQILYTTLEAPGPDDIAREVQIRSGLDGLTPYPVGELVFDWRADGERARVAVLARETMDEAETFAVEHKFNPVSFVARPQSGEFSGEPFFGKTRAATKILGPTERVEPDASPVPRRARKIEPVADHTAAPDISSTAPTFKPAPRSDQPDWSAPPMSDPRGSRAAPEPDPDDPFAELDAIAAELSGDPEATPDDAAASRPARARRSRSRRARGAEADAGPPPLAPFPPTDDEAEAQPTAPAKPARTQNRAPDKAPGGARAETPGAKPEAPSAARRAPPAETARTAPGAAAGRRSGAQSPATAPNEPASQDGPDAAATPSPGVSFVTRRNGNGAATTTATVTGRQPRPEPDGRSAPQRPAEPSRPQSAPASPATRPAPQSSPRRAASDEDRRRAAMADALSRPMPGADGKATPEDKPRGGGLGNVSGALRGAGFRSFGQRRSEPRDEPEAVESSLEQLMRKEAEDEARISPYEDDFDAPDPTGTPQTPPAPEPGGRFAEPGHDADAAPASAPPPAPASRSAEQPAVTSPGTAADEMPVAEPARDAPPPQAAPGETGRIGAAQPKPMLAKSAGAGDLGRGKASGKPDRADEARTLTVFGARRAQEGRGSSKRLGVILTLLLLLVMAIIAIWSSLFVGDGSDGALFNPDPEVEVAPAETPETATETPPAATEPAVDAEPAADTPEPATAPDDTGAAAGTGEPEVLTPEEAETRYAATGIWQRAPVPMPEPRTPQLETGAFPDPGAPRPDAEQPTLPETVAGAFSTSGRATPLPPPPQGTQFDLDENGLVRPSPEGTLSPDGYKVFTGPPDLVPPPRPGSAAPEDAALPVAPVPPGAGPRPATSPGVDDVATGPAAAAAAAEVSTATTDPAAAIEAAVEDAIAASASVEDSPVVEPSPIPHPRPGNFDSIVEAALANRSNGAGATAAAATTTPEIPTSANVANQATTPNAINLRQVNLIGVSGASNARRALVRMPNGRYVTVRVGDRLDGGTVTSITATGLTYQKGSRALALEILPLG